jgi:hypothetical protein
MPNLSDNDHDDNKDVKSDNDDSSNYNNDDDNKDVNANQACTVRFDDKLLQEDDETEDQGVWRSRRKSRGVTDKYANYTLLMAACRKECSGKHCVIIRDSVCFFLNNGLSIATPLPEKDRYKYALRVALVTYSIGQE